MTFITPLAIAHATHNQASDYTEHAANQHFVLQESVRMSGAGSHGAGGVLEKGGAVAAAVVGQALSSLGRMLVGSTGSGTTAGDPRPQSGGIATGMILDTPPQTPQLSRKRTVADYRYRIILKLLATGDAQRGGSGSIYVVAVSDTLKDIHTDWHWIEQHLFR